MPFSCTSQLCIVSRVLYLKMDDEDVGTSSDSSSDDPHAPPRKIRRPPDSYSPANYNAIYITTIL